MKLLEVIFEADNMDILHIPGELVKMVEVSGVREQWKQYWGGPYQECQECDRLIMALPSEANVKCSVFNVPGNKEWLFDRLKVGDMMAITLRLMADNGKVVDKSAFLPWKSVMVMGLNDYATYAVDEDDILWIVYSKDLTADEFVAERK